MNWQAIRLKILKRDGFKCAKCSTGTKLEVHHKDGKGRQLSTREQNNNPSNLITLCKLCHKQIHKTPNFPKHRTVYTLDPIVIQQAQIDYNLFMNTFH